MTSNSVDQLNVLTKRKTFYFLPDNKYRGEFKKIKKEIAKSKKKTLDFDASSSRLACSRRTTHCSLIEFCNNATDEELKTAALINEW